ncbi:electroneutral sodium bicarbonate exchanger 1-like [Octopus sinensis]|uniref:Anion exchange protein n=1 Tax=Octopus sinensis TaxID=2607531 RepID=A0A7E6FLL0_9MOLL|nr:electroneutral sodium bicarbonate exchanger 1-like [Octopus sinensis]
MPNTSLTMPSENESNTNNALSEHSIPVSNSDLYLGENPPYKVSDNVSEVIQQLMHNVNDEDHQAHHIFCEMDVLHREGEAIEWKESARWVKYEEDVEDGGERWSKPHVASLSMHALFSLKKSIIDGAVLLDIDASDISSVIDQVITTWQQHSGMTKSNERERARDVLLKQHKHLYAKRRYKANLEKLRSVRSLYDLHHSHVESKSLDNLKSVSSNQSLDSGVTSGESGELHPNKGNLHFMRKIPKDAEVANMMVGELESLSKQYLAFVRLHKSRIIGELTEVTLPTKFLFILLSPVGHKHEVQEIGRSMSTMMVDEIFREVAYKCRNKSELVAGIEEFMVQGTVLPPGGWDPKIRIEPPLRVPSQQMRRNSSASSLKEVEEVEEDHFDPTLVRSGRIFGGLINDFKRKLPWYASDFKDCLHVQCLASVIFLFLATFTQNVTFGGILGSKTKGYMGTMECILTAALSGVVFALFSGQPLNILGSTGPMLVLETIIYQFCQDNDWDFMPLRFWVGMWTVLILLIVVAFDMSALVKYITRFTEESFACLIAIIFIVEAFDKLADIGIKIAPMNVNPDVPISNNCSCFQNSSLAVANSNNETACNLINGTLKGDGCNPPSYKDNVFLMSILLFLGTFTISMALKMFRAGTCFPTIVRQITSDFAVFIAIIVMSGIDAAVGLDTPKLTVPTKFQPTDPSKRDWVINPISSKNPWWLYIAACLPAMLASILVFLDQQITSVIVNRKENKLVKGGGYHLDMLVVAVLIGLCSLFGLPWYVAATVSALAHIMSLKRESECNAPGERPVFLGVREQRVTAICVGILSGLSVLLTSILKIIPMPVLYGVFLYMGVVALSGMQLMTSTS